MCGADKAMQDREWRTQIAFWHKKPRARYALVGGFCTHKTPQSNFLVLSGFIAPCSCADSGAITVHDSKLSGFIAPCSCADSGANTVHDLNLSSFMNFHPICVWYQTIFPA